MTSLTIQIPDQTLQQLQQLAQAQGLSPEQLVQNKIEHWLTEPEKDFNQVMDYVLQKNAELYNLLESVHLLKSPENAKRLFRSLDWAATTTEESQSLESLKKELSFEP